MFAGRNMPERRSNGTRTLALPTYGRFLQADPLGYGDGMNMYAYVGNDPVNWTDPTGTKRPDQGWWKCYGNCGSGYANDSMNGTFVYSPGSSGTEWDAKGNETQIVTSGKWTFVPNSTPINFGADFGFNFREPGLSKFERETSTKSEEPARGSYDPNINYCGGSGSVGLPNNVGGASFNNACYRHDVCYSRSGIAKSTCDLQFANRVALQMSFGGLGRIPITFLPGTALLVGVAAGSAVHFGGGKFYVP